MAKLKSPTVLGVSKPSNLGIDNIKTILGTALEIGQDVIEVASDFSVTKALQVAFKVTGYGSIAPMAKQAFAELKDLDTQEASEVSEYFALKFDIENDKVEAYIEEALELAAEAYPLALANIAFAQKVATYVRKIA